MKAGGVLLATILIFQAGCLRGECDSIATGKWVQPGVYNEAVTKGLKTNPYSEGVGFEDTNINNMTVGASIRPGDKVFAQAFRNGPPSGSFPLNQFEGAVRELFQRYNLTFNPAHIELGYSSVSCS